MDLSGGRYCLLSGWDEPACQLADDLMHCMFVPVRDNTETAKGMRSDGTFRTCREGSWMTFFGGKYYLQFATPGTTVSGYCDAYAIGNSPLGPFKISPASPMARKDSGFITSAGHSCL